MACVLCASCASPARHAATSPDAPPPDFALSIIVREDAAGLTPARYVLDADGALRAAIGPGAGPDTFPTFTRRLDEDERRDLWRLALAAGAADPARRAIASDERAAFRRGERVIVWVRADEQAGVLSADPARDGTTRTLIEAFERLAWVR